MRRYLSIIFLFTFLFVAPFNVSAQTPTPSTGSSAQSVDCTKKRCAQCDVCGYCFEEGTIPGSWESCRNCMYPQFAQFPAESNKTLQINTNRNSENFGNPVKPKKGAYYTQLGCIQTDVGSFSDPAASGVLVDFILNTVIFRIVGGIAFIYLLYGAFVLMTSQDNPQRIREGRSIVIGSIIGLVFTISVVFIINLIASEVLKIPGFGSNPVPNQEEQMEVVEE